MTAPATPAAALTADQLKTETRAAVLAAYEAEGYMKDTGGGVMDADNDLLATKIAAELEMRAVCSSQVEKEAKAVGIGSLTEVVFASTPAPGSAGWEDDDDGVNSSAWVALVGVVGRLVATGVKGKVQKLVGKNGLVLVQAKVRLDKTKSVYLTNDETLLLLDYVGDRSGKLQNIAESVGADLGMVAARVPAMKKKVEVRFDTGLKNAAISGKAKMAQLAGGSTTDDSA